MFTIPTSYEIAIIPKIVIFKAYIINQLHSYYIKIDKKGDLKNGQNTENTKYNYTLEIKRTFCSFYPNVIDKKISTTSSKKRMYVTTSCIKIVFK